MKAVSPRFSVPQASFAGDLLGAYDDDDDFRINRDEFRRLAHDMHQLDVTRAAKLFKDMDIDGDGRLSESEFGRLVPALQVRVALAHAQQCR